MEALEADELDLRLRHLKEVGGPRLKCIFQYPDEEQPSQNLV